MCLSNMNTRDRATSDKCIIIIIMMIIITIIKRTNLLGECKRGRIIFFNICLGNFRHFKSFLLVSKIF